MTDEKIQKIKRLIARFLEHVAMEHGSPYTIRNYRYGLRPFLDFLRGQDEEDLARVTADTVYRYQMHLYAAQTRDRPLSLNTQCGRLTVVRSFFRYLVQRGHVWADPTSGLELPRPKKGLPRGVMTRREVEKVLAQPDPDTPLGLRDKAILEVLYSTGLRNGELRNLTVQDVDIAQEELRVREGKGGRDRVLPLGEIAARYVEQYAKHARPVLAGKNPEPVPFLFVNHQGRKLGDNALNYPIVQKYVKRARLSKRVTPHSFRHTCATHMLKGRANIRHIQALLGHKSLETTQIYTRVEVGDLKREHRRTHPRERPRG